NSNFIKNLGCRSWVSYFENSTLDTFFDLDVPPEDLKDEHLIRAKDAEGRAFIIDMNGRPVPSATE
ncbi:hypothetical protein RYB36_07745, partial [Pseudomonas syringae pv. actinidiae]